MQLKKTRPRLRLMPNHYKIQHVIIITSPLFVRVAEVAEVVVVLIIIAQESDQLKIIVIIRSKKQAVRILGTVANKGRSQYSSWHSSSGSSSSIINPTSLIYNTKNKWISKQKNQKSQPFPS